MADLARVNQSFISKTETTVTIKWVSDTVIDYIWYSVNGLSWTGFNTPDGASGSYTIGGLNANTTYQIKTRVRRKDNQTTSDSTAMSVTTYNFPYAASMPNFRIGDRFTIGLYNPLGRSVTVNILGDDNSQCTNDVTTGTSITGYAGETIVNNFYASIPNAKSGTYRVRVTYNGQVSTKTGGTYTVNVNDCKPSITAVDYQDTISSVIAITGNAKDIVQNQSVVNYVASGLIAQKSATVSSCSVSVNGDTYNLTLSGGTATGGNAKIDSGTDVEAVFTVTDSRGVTATKSITVKMLAWKVPSAIIKLERRNNYYSETNVNVDANYPSINGNNRITIQYNATSESGTTLAGVLQDKITTVINLDNTLGWTVVIVLVDSFGGRTTYTAYISRGMPLIFFDRLLSSVGINCFPKEEQSLEVNGYNLSRNVRDIMTCGLSLIWEDLSVDTDTIVHLDLPNSVGNKLAITNDGGIKIGANVNKVLVSGMLTIQPVGTSGFRRIRIVKNSISSANTIGWAYREMAASSYYESLAVAPVLADVEEGDVIYLCYLAASVNDIIGGNSYGNRTYLTVEVV